MQSRDIQLIFLWISVFCSIVSGQAFATTSTFVELIVNSNTSFKSDPTGAGISDSRTFAGELAEGAAAIGTLNARVAATTSAFLDTSLVQFTDSFTIAGNGMIRLSQNIHGTQSVIGSGTAIVIGTLDLSALHFIGMETRHQKDTSTISSSFEFDDGPLTLSVSDGQVYSILATLEAIVTNGAGSSTISDFVNTDNIFITPLTPGVTIISESGHDYASVSGPPPGVPEPNTGLLLAIGVIGLMALRGKHGNARRQCTSSFGAGQKLRRIQNQ